MPGIQAPMVYVGGMFTSFAWHVEDGNLCSINYLHAGKPKFWWFYIFYLLSYCHGLSRDFDMWSLKTSYKNVLFCQRRYIVSRKLNQQCAFIAHCLHKIISTIHFYFYFVAHTHIRLSQNRFDNEISVLLFFPGLFLTRLFELLHSIWNDVAFRAQPFAFSTILRLIYVCSDSALLNRFGINCEIFSNFLKSNFIKKIHFLIGWETIFQSNNDFFLWFYMFRYINW